MKIAAFMMSCPERESVRQQTIEELQKTDWLESPTIVLDEARHVDRAARQAETCRRLLSRAVTTDADVILFLEDDLRFNRHLRHNLVTWSLLQSSIGGSHFFASLYNPGIRPRHKGVQVGHYEAVPQRVYGSQALLLRPATIQVILERWESFRTLVDIRMSRAAASVTAIYYHRPSLVDHAPVSSVLGTMSHQAFDFDPDWRRETKS